MPEASPQNVNCSSLSSQSIKVSWKEPPLHLHGGIIQGYKILYRPLVKQSKCLKKINYKNNYVNKCTTLLRILPLLYYKHSLNYKKS